MESFLDKYKPTDFDSVVLSDTHAKSLLTRYKNGRCEDNIILFGGYGTGKSSLAKIIPSLIVPNIQPPDIKVINSQRDSGVEIQKSFFQQNKMAAGMNSKGLKFLIYEEADSLTKQAQQLLQVAMEEYKSIYRFVFTTNHPHNISGAITSRCQKAEILPATAEDWFPRAKFILKQEGLSVPKKELMQVLEENAGDNREILRALEDIVYSFK